MTGVIKYSVVVPVFNSEESLEELYSRLEVFFRGTCEDFEVIMVDDASHDRSWEVISDLKKQHPDRVTGIQLSRNYGQHNATFCGLAHARGEWIVTIDDDLQVPPEETGKLIAEQIRSGAELVYGVFGTKQHSRVRNLGSSSLKTSARTLHDSPGEGSSFRLISSGLVRKILHHEQHFIYLDEILPWYTRHIAFTETDHLPRKYRHSGYSFGKLVAMFANIVWHYTMVPLKLLVYGGFIISLVTFAVGVYFIAKKILFDVPLGYTSLIVTILFSTSIILFSLGVLGEYLSRIYQVQNRKPTYSIRRVL